MVEDQKLITLQKEKAKAYMDAIDPKGKFSYHCWNHVQHVIDAAADIIKDYKLDVDHEEDILLATIWHDSDFANGKVGHEERSAKIATEELKQYGFSEERLTRITRLIKSTQMAHMPNEEDERIIKDADLAHLGSLSYMTFYADLYKEIKAIENPQLTEEQWRKLCVEFTESVNYHTKAAQNRYSKIKLENIEKLKQMSDIDSLPEEHILSKEEKKRIKKEAKKNAPKYNAEKGIETMFRISLKNHIALSQIADQKANTLISVNAIVLSIVLSALFPKLDSNPWLLYPGISLILVSIITIIMATLSTIPKTTHGTVSKEDVENKRGNLLFFGNFHKMTLPEYEWGINELMKDGAYLYGSLTRDLYFLGLVLNRKYSLLRYGYFVFVIGLLISIGLFLGAVVFMSPNVNL